MNQETKKHTEDNRHKIRLKTTPHLNQTNTKAMCMVKATSGELRYTQTDETWNELPGKMKPVC